MRLPPPTDGEIVRVRDKRIPFSYWPTFPGRTREGLRWTLFVSDPWFLIENTLRPSVAQVEYRDGQRHLLATLYHTPIHDTLTRVYFVQCFRLPGPRFLVRALVGRSVDRVLQQDVEILREQTASLRRFGGEQYASTELDLLGPEIWRMLRQAERGLDPESKDVEARIKLRV